MNPRKTIISSVIAVPIILGIGFFLNNQLASLRDTKWKSAPPSRRKDVSVIPVKYSTISATIQSRGRVISNEQVDIISEVQGQILRGSIPLKPGQTFKKGQVLLRVDNQVSRMNIQSSKSEFINTLANMLPDLKLDYPDNFKAWETYYNNLDISKAFPKPPTPKSGQEKNFITSRGVYTKYYALLSEQENLGKHTIIAPFDGSFSEVSLQVGTVVSPGSRIAKAIRTDNLEVELPIDNGNLQWVANGDSVSLWSDDHRQFSGTITRIGNFVNPNTQSINLYVNVTPDKKNPLYEGEYLEAEVFGKALPKGMEVPRSALRGKTAFVVRDSALYSQEVEIIKTNPEHAIIRGLKEGELMVNEPLTSIQEGMPVIPRIYIKEEEAK